MPPDRVDFSRKYDFADGDDDMGMRFLLRYVGKLPADTARGEFALAKHRMRKQLHVQLSDLVRRSPMLQLSVSQTRGLVTHSAMRFPELEEVGRKCRLKGFEFVPLIAAPSMTACELDIEFLRRERPGHLIDRIGSQADFGGDLDNRIKTFIDALRVPPQAQDVPDGETPEATETPFYCLLQDDSYVTAFRVASEMLLGPNTPDAKKDVELIARVTTRPMQAHWTDEDE